MTTLCIDQMELDGLLRFTRKDVDSYYDESASTSKFMIRYNRISSCDMKNGEYRYGSSASIGFGGNVAARYGFRAGDRGVYGAEGHSERFYAGCLCLSGWVGFGR